MKINLTGIKSNSVPSFVVQGQTLIIGKDILDFSVLQNEEIAENDSTENMYFQKASKDNLGVITVDILFPYNHKTYEKGKDILSSVEVIGGAINPYGVAI